LCPGSAIFIYLQTGNCGGSNRTKRLKRKTPVTNKDDQLLAVMARRNWYILAILVLVSLLWRSVLVTKSVLAGGLLAIIAYGWLYRSLIKVLSNPDKHTARGFQITYFVRLAALAAAIFLLITKGGIQPMALSAGLSVVVVNVVWTTLRRVF